MASLARLTRSCSIRFFRGLFQKFLRGGGRCWWVSHWRLNGISIDRCRYGDYRLSCVMRLWVDIQFKYLPWRWMSNTKQIARRSMIYRIEYFRRSSGRFEDRLSYVSIGLNLELFPFSSGRHFTMFFLPQIKFIRCNESIITIHNRSPYFSFFLSFSLHFPLSSSFFFFKQNLNQSYCVNKQERSREYPLIRYYEAYFWLWNADTSATFSDWVPSRLPVPTPPIYNTMIQ